METQAYLEMAATENEHWWFVARRQILARLISALRLPKTIRILEIGAGTGGNLAMLQQFGSVDAVERDPMARQLAAQNHGISLQEGSLPYQMPVPPGSYDLICLFDVLEHIGEDQAALAALRPLMKPGGRVILTVPAYRWLWSEHDIQLHHHRRYTRSGLLRLAADAGFRCSRISYFNTALLPLIVAARLLNRWLPRQVGRGTTSPSMAINALLRRIFASERLLLPYINLPAGLSLYMELM